MLRFLLVLVFCGTAGAQWQVQASGTTADLRGIHSLGRGVAWASGSGGTVLRTLDGGKHWTACAVPPGAEKLDFRGVQAFDAKTAIVMSSGKGDLSRLYKTVDGCGSWKLLLTNPDPEGFWDAIAFSSPASGYLLGDPVAGHFTLLRTADGGQTWLRVDPTDLQTPRADMGAFAASNTSMALLSSGPIFGTGAAYVYRGERQCPLISETNDPMQCLTAITFDRVHLPIQSTNSSSGVFSIAAAGTNLVAVGGNYEAANDSHMVAAYSRDEGRTWKPAEQPPGGYRSAVAYSSADRAWITVGPNGTDISIDDGLNWRPLRPATGGEPGEDQRWNALSLPFVVGPKGRIGVLRDGVLGTP